MSIYSKGREGRKASKNINYISNESFCFVK